MTVHSKKIQTSIGVTDISSSKTVLSVAEQYSMLTDKNKIIVDHQIEKLIALQSVRQS